MTNEEILAKLVALGFEASLNDSKVYLREDVPEPPSESGREPHDEVWTRYCEIQEELGESGLTLTDIYLDHDTVGGYVVEREVA